MAYCVPAVSPSCCRPISRILYGVDACRSRHAHAKSVGVPRHGLESLLGSHRRETRHVRAVGSSVSWQTRLAGIAGFILAAVVKVLHAALTVTAFYPIEVGAGGFSYLDLRPPRRTFFAGRTRELVLGLVLAGLAILASSARSLVIVLSFGTRLAGKL